jgi:hypothetical protein
VGIFARKHHGGDVATATNKQRAKQISSERLFFAGMAATILIVVLIGFGPQSYFLPFTGSVREQPFTWVALLHIALFSSWVVLLISQTALVSVRRTKLHMRLGVAAVALAPAMILSAVLLVLGLIASDPAMSTGARSAFLISLVDLVAFGGLVYAALRSRRNPAAHKRLMLLATISLLGATAIARLPLPDLGFGVGRYSNALIISELMLLPLVLRDVLTLRRLHPATIWGSLTILAAHAVQIICIKWTAWRALADSVGVALSS